MRSRTIFVVATLLAAAPILGGCDSFDMDKFDVFHLNDKKKLPGERKTLFPEGVPGAAQGIPPDLVKGYKPPEVAEEPPPEAEPKPAPKPRVVRRTPKPTPITVQPAPQQQPQQAQQQQQQPAWPEPKTQAQPQQAGQPDWPAPPPSNTFQR